ncbi:MAG: response regulator [Chloroflexia bacterium]|nr:response regulator [Chloroflexia bacterium]
MTAPLRVLILEDRPADVELILYELRRAGFEPRWQRVEDEQGYLENLTPDLDIILADYNLPHFDGPTALRLLQQKALDIPFIVVTGSISEEVAVECMKQGAADYLIKDRMGRLGQAVDHALQQRRLREAKRQAEIALQESETLFRSLIENISDVIAIVDSHGRIRYLSPSVERVLGYQVQELSERSILSLVHAQDQDLLRRMLQGSAKAGPLSAELRFCHQHGAWHILEVMVNNLLQDPVVGGLVVTFRDISDRRQLEDQLRQSQKLEAIGRLAGGIAHDFNNLLMAIIGYSDLILNSLDALSPLRKDVEEIHKAGERAAALTSQLLTFSRKQVTETKVLNLNNVVKDMAKLLRRLIGEDVELFLQLEGSLAPVRADPSQWGQVIMNLAVNSRDAMPQGGKLIIETANVELEADYARRHVDVQPGSYVMLAVSDTGIGMTAEVLSHIFEPFFTTKGQDKGTGLGLSTVYGIVRQSDGHIWVYSEPNQGTTFKIYLPRVDEPVEQTTPSLLQEALRGTETVLVVEDEEMVRNLAARILRRYGYTVLEAHHPTEAIELAKQHSGPLDLLLTDMVLPIMNGRELAQQLVQQRPRLSVLYVSGYTGRSILEQGLIEEDAFFLEKPFTPNVLLQQVRQVLDHKAPGYDLDRGPADLSQHG